jgi:hypothetical protein
MKSFQSLVAAFSLVAAARAWGDGWNGTYVTTTITTDIYTSKSSLSDRAGLAINSRQPTALRPLPSLKEPTPTLPLTARPSPSPTA